MKKSIVAASIALALGVSASAQAGFLANSSTYAVTIGAGSCFTFGDCSGAPANVQGGSFTISTDATGSAFSVGSYAIGVYTATSGGIFTTGGPVAGSGTVGAGGEIDLDFAGRTGSAQFFPYLGTPAWNIDDNTKTGGTGNYEGFTSSTDSNLDPTDTTGSTVSLTLSGTHLTLASTDGITGTWTGQIVSVGNVGQQWGAFDGTPYSEVYNISVQGPSAAPAVPVPAAVWLFGTGLIGLVGVARRRKTA